MGKRKRAGGAPASGNGPDVPYNFQIPMQPINKVARLGNHQVEAPRQRTIFKGNGTAHRSVEQSTRLDFDQASLDDDYWDDDDEDRDIPDSRAASRRQRPLKRGMLRRRRPSPELVLITPEFRARATTRTTCPWLDPSSPAHDSSNQQWRLHVEIEQFYEFVRPHHYEIRARKWVVDQVKTMVNSRGANAEVKVFGSFATNLNLPTGDLDLVLVEPFYSNPYAETPEKSQMRTALNKYQGLLRNSSFQIVNVIRHSKIPLIKFKDRSTGIDIDLSFNNLGGIPAIATVKKWTKEYRAMPPLVMIIKQLLLMRDLNDVAYQGMGSFTIICLVTNFLMQHPSQRNPEQRNSNLQLGTLLIEFLEFYGSKFNRNHLGIFMEEDRSSYFPKPGKEKNNGKFHIIDPNNPPRDIASGTNRATDVAKVFRDSKDALERAMQAGEDAGKGKGPSSLLDCIIGGDYGIYRSQRGHLKQVAADLDAHEARRGGPQSRPQTRMR